MSGRNGNGHAGDVLTEAISLTDLPGLIAELYSASGAKPRTPGLVFAAWRGNENTPALSLSRVQGRWLWKDHATGDGGNAFNWLVQAHGMSPQAAADYLLERSGLASQELPEAPARRSDDPPKAKYRPLPPEAVEALSALPLGAVPPMKGRGFSKKLLQAYNIRSDNGRDALIPITNPEGVVLQVKRRLAGADKPGSKYRYEHKGYGGPAWCSPGSREAPLLLIVEGELNAMVAHAALQQAGETEIGVMGVAGAKSALYPGLAKGKRVLVYADDDAPGEEARVAWSKAAHDEGARSVRTIPPHTVDFCDFAGQHGLDALAEMLDAMRHASQQVYGASDRLLGGLTVREVMAATERLLDGGVMHSTGFTEVDQATGGIREAGIYSIGALSSMGKSAVMRRMLLAHLRDGGKVRAYSPDQAAPAIYRLLANQLSGVGMEELRSGRYHPDSLELWGSPEGAKKAWWETYEYVLTDIAPRFQVSEESHSSAIVKDMEKAVAEGVTMFGIDYMQLIRPPGSSGKDGDQADELMVASGRLGVPIIAALQLAKYKYPPERRSGIPAIGDIEGSGAYFQDSEMMFLVYNEEIYGAKYAGDKWEPVGDPPGTGRLLMRKDKEGRGDDEWLIRWDARLAAYTDHVAGRATYDVARERKGLMD